MVRNSIKIAFFVQWMLCGGVENALIALSEKLIAVGHDVTIYFVYDSGDFMNRIPVGVKHNKIPLPKFIEKKIPIGGIKLALKKNLKEHNYVNVIAMIIKYIFYKPDFAELNVNFDQIQDLHEKYDIAVNFHMHSPFLVRYLADKVTADKKITWIHNDFTTTGYNVRKLKKYLRECDNFYGVSQRIVKEFVDIFPEFIKKTYVMYNIVPVRDIKEKSYQKSVEFDNVSEDEKIILSVGRLEKQKGYNLTISAARILLNNGYKFQWFILGEGSERNKLEKLIKKNGLQRNIHFIGIRMNPYPYFKNCDIYVQTSLHEGYVTTVTEARIFQKPIVCTDVSGAREQIIDGINGFITGFTAKDIANKIMYLLDNNFKVREKKIIDYESICKANLEIFRV